MMARGMRAREIIGHLREMYGLAVSPDRISTITDDVPAEVEQWQQRPLKAMYPIVCVSALQLKIRDEGTVRNKAVYLARGIRVDGSKAVLGLWIKETEGTKFWLKLFDERKNRGLQDILIAVVDGLRGFPEVDGGGDVAAAIGAGHPLLRLPTRSAQDHVCDQRHREHAHAATQDGQESRAFRERRGRQQAAVPRRAISREPRRCRR